MTLKVASHLSALLPEADRPEAGAPAIVALAAGPWCEVVAEMRARLPRLVERILTETGDVAPGFVLVVNDEVVRRPDSFLLVQDGDEVCLIAALAGG